MLSLISKEKFIAPWGKIKIQQHLKGHVKYLQELRIFWLSQYTEQITQTNQAKPRLFVYIHIPSHMLNATDLYLVLGFHHFKKNSPFKQKARMKIMFY